MGRAFDSADDLRLDEYNNSRTYVDDWLRKMSEEGIVTMIDPDHLKVVFEFHGAAETIGEESRKILRLYMPGEASDGMEAVWGDTRLDYFEAFLSKWIADYNLKASRRLPKTDSRDMGVGMKRFFLELTQLAYGEIAFEDFKLRTESALLNFNLWNNHEDDKRISLPTPKSGNKPIRVSVISPHFIDEFYEWIKKPLTHV